MPRLKSSNSGVASKRDRLKRAPCLSRVPGALLRLPLRKVKCIITAIRGTRSFWRLPNRPALYRRRILATRTADGCGLGTISLSP